MAKEVVRRQENFRERAHREVSGLDEEIIDGLRSHGSALLELDAHLVESVLGVAMERLAEIRGIDLAGTHQALSISAEWIGAMIEDDTLTVSARLHINAPLRNVELKFSYQLQGDQQRVGQLLLVDNELLGYSEHASFLVRPLLAVANPASVIRSWLSQPNHSLQETLQVAFETAGYTDPFSLKLDIQQDYVTAKFTHVTRRRD